MKKKSIIAFLLACSFAFGAAAFTGCNVIGGDPNGNQNQTDTGNKTPDDGKDENKKPEDEYKKPGDESKRPEVIKGPEDDER
ncbi:MAG: hypothetical protein K2N17_05970, partial [Clostridia bacterium]|nr:hypothetical protein [Clostridia bacterium]